METFLKKQVCINQSYAKQLNEKCESKSPVKLIGLRSPSKGN